ncbi:MAG TPA: M48 family metallopeptidase [Chloroflexota bacterium]|nr:M48 family metallopeptidase [Chloroflexota bacterium]
MDEEADPPVLRLLTLIALLVALPVVGLIAGASAGELVLVAAAGGALALGLGLVVAIWLAGLIARTNRVVLVLVFAPLLILTNVALVPLIAINGAVATFAVGALFPIAGVLMGIGAVFGVVAMLGRALSFPFARTPTLPVRGVPITADEQPRVWAFVQDLAASMHATPPQQIVVGLEPNFFVTHARVAHLDGEVRGRTLFLSLSFCRILSAEELKAIVAHELGHFQGWDTRFSEVFYPVYRGAVESLVSLRSEMSEGISGLPLYPAYSVLQFFLDSFAEAEARLQRTRELAADRCSVAATDAQTMASALVKVHGFHRYWRRAIVVLRDNIASAKKDLNVSRDFAEAAAEHKDSWWMRHDLDQEEPPHPTDSHPPLSRRLQAVSLTIQDVSQRAFTVSPATPALDLFQEAEALERRLTLVEKEILIESRQVFEGSKVF